MNDLLMSGWALVLVLGLVFGAGLGAGIYIGVASERAALGDGNDWWI